MDDASSTLDEVRRIIISTLGIDDRAESVTADTKLLGALPELDSLAIVEIVTTLEDRFGFEIDESDFTAEVFKSVATLAAFVESQRTAGD
jgi:acyl carrier protein